MRRRLACLLLAAAAPLAAQGLPDGPPVVRFDPGLGDSAGVPMPVLVAAKRPDGAIWYGTYGRGIVVREANGTVRRITSDTGSTALSWDFVHAIAFGPRGQVWAGTIGNGWSLSLDDGRTWRNWTFTRLGPEWQYVAADGIRVRGDTTIILTADGLQITTDDGARWVAITDSVGPVAKGPADTALAILGNEYAQGGEVRLDMVPSGRTDAQGRDLLVPQRLAPGAVLFAGLGGRATAFPLRDCLRAARGDATAVCRATAYVTSDGAGGGLPTGFRPAAGPVAGSAKGWAPWFARPIAAGDNDAIDQTYRWGSTMGGNFQPHQGVEFNNPDGTRVLAIGDGTVVYAGPAERGALTVAIRHDSALVVGDVWYNVFSVYYHNAELAAVVGARVRRGDVIARVGHTGRATNDHLHLEVHASPSDSVRAIVDSLNRYPAWTTNPELWIAPRPGTGVVAGTIVDAAGAPIPQARIYGLVKPAPRETPFVFAESYGPRNRPHPRYREHFAVGDVPAGWHTLWTIIDGRRIERRVEVKAGALAWVEFRP